METYIGVVDGNNFFVSCERLFRPDLLQQPVLVLSSNDGCVVARSQEVKDLGIVMGMPYFQIKDLIRQKGVTVFSSNFKLYRNLSQRLFSVLKKEVEEFEQYSIDEAFFLLKAKDRQAAEVVARELKVKLERLVGIPVSIGLGANKTQAKYASRLAKSGDGLRVLDVSTWQSLTKEIDLHLLWGVGAKSAERYRREGLLKVVDLLNYPLSLVRGKFGVVGERLRAELDGEMIFLLNPVSGGQQSLTDSRSLKKATYKQAEVLTVLAGHVEAASATLRKKQLLAETLTVIAYPARGQSGGFSETISLPAPTSNTSVIMKYANAVLVKRFSPEVGYRKLGITLGSLMPENFQNGSLFTETETVLDEGLWQTVDMLNSRFHSTVLRSGVSLQPRGLLPASSWRSPEYVSAWQEIPTVQS